LMPGTPLFQLPESMKMVLPVELFQDVDKWAVERVAADKIQQRAK
jgi:hypothetical protein